MSIETNHVVQAMYLGQHEVFGVVSMRVEENDNIDYYLIRLNHEFFHNGEWQNDLVISSEEIIEDLGHYTDYLAHQEYFFPEVVE